MTSYTRAWNWATIAAVRCDDKAIEMSPRDKAIPIFVKTLLVVLVAGALGTPLARACLEFVLGRHIDETLFYNIWGPAVLIAMALFWPRQLKELKKIAAEKRALAKQQRPVPSPLKSDADVVFRRRPWRYLLPAGTAIFFVISALTSRTLTLGGYVLVFGVAAAMVLYSISELRYAVIVTEGEVRVTGLIRTTVCRRSEIKSAEVQRLLGKVIVLTLYDGRKEYIFDSVTHFDDLVSILGASEQ